MPAFEVQLQEEKANTCVACATVNAIRCFGLDVDAQDIIDALAVRRLGKKGGSYVIKAVKYLAKEHRMQVVASRPPFIIEDPIEAAREAATRFASLLEQGFVGLLHHKVSRRMGHAVVLTEILWKDGEPYFVTFDSNKRGAGGRWVYRAAEFVLFIDSEQHTLAEWLFVAPEDREPTRMIPTGRTAWFVKPRRVSRADGPPGG